METITQYPIERASIERTQSNEKAPAFIACRRVDRAVALGAAVAFGSLAGCSDADQGPKVPVLAATTSVLEFDADRAEGASPDEPPSLALDAEEGRIDTFAASPGFTPDPRSVSGVMHAGPIDASEVDDRCEGWLAVDPDVVFTAERPFAELAIMVASEADTTLFVLDPDGEARCGDDEDGEHPIVRGLFAQGVYRVWVGAEERDASGPFVLALTELDDSRPSRLLH